MSTLRYILGTRWMDEELRAMVRSDVVEVLPYLRYGILVAAVFLAGYAVYRGLFKLLDKKPDYPLDRALVMALFLIYMTVVAWRTLLSRAPGTLSRVEVEAFSTWGTSIKNSALFIENILMFIPFGVLAPLCFRRLRSFPLCVGAALSLSFAIEMTQFVLQVGFTQMDDLLTNTYGAILGWCGFTVVYIPYRAIKKVLEILPKR